MARMLGVFLNSSDFSRVVDMRLDLVARLCPQLLHEQKHDRQHIEVFLRLRLGVLERLHQPLAGVLDRLHRIGDHEGAKRRPADDDVFPRLPDDEDVAAHRHEAAQHAAERDDKPEKNGHVLPSPMRSSEVEVFRE